MEIGGSFALQEIGTPQPDNIFRWLNAYEAIYTDSGRSAIRLLSSVLPKGPVLLPAYICKSVCDCFPGRPFRFFRLTEDLCIDWDDLFQQLDGSAVLYLHYFNGALPEKSCLRRLLVEVKRRKIPVVEDTTHSLFSAPLTIGDYGVCSLRKWFPIPDGGVLYGKCLSGIPLPMSGEAPWVQNTRYAMELKARYLCGEVPESCNLTYRTAFTEGEEALDRQEVCFRLSSFSHTVLQNSIVTAVATARRQNYRILHDKLKDISGLRAIGTPGHGDCPLTFPIRLTNRDAARAYLTSQNIYCPIHWPMEGALMENSESVKTSQEELSLPVDQRYDEADMSRLADSLRKFMGAISC